MDNRVGQEAVYGRSYGSLGSRYGHSCVVEQSDFAQVDVYRIRFADGYVACVISTALVFDPAEIKRIRDEVVKYVQES